MAHQPRMFQHNAAYFVTNRLAEGLPLVPNPYINSLLFGVLARAQSKYPSILISAWLFLPNHYHAILVPNGDPAELACFMNYVDGEIAKTISKLLGKKHWKVWSGNYCAAKILDFNSLIKEMTYLFLNPVAANLVAKAEDWRGVTTWKQLFDPTVISYKWIKPGQVATLPNAPFRKQLLRNLLDSLTEIETETNPFHIQPFCWKQLFASSSSMSDDQLRDLLIAEIKDAENLYKCERTEKNLVVVGAQTLAEQNPHKKYKPKKFSPRVFCLSTDSELRMQFIALYKDFCERCQQVWERWKKGDYSIDYPPGAFRPPTRPSASLLLLYP